MHIDKKCNLKNMKECDNSTRKIHISNNFVLSISLLIMFDTLLLTITITTLQHSATLHHTSPNYISLHFATLHHISPHFAHLHFTTLIDTSLPLICTSFIPPNLLSTFMAGYRVNCTLTLFPMAESPITPRPYYCRSSAITLRHTKIGRTPLDK